MPTALWIVSGTAFIEEAKASAASLERTMPGIRRKIFEIPRISDRWYLDCCSALAGLLPWIADDEILYLDSDVCFLQAAPEILQLLQRFDFVAAHAAGRITAPTQASVPASFPEFNVGVIAMRNNARIQRLWRYVADNLECRPDVYGNNDQAPLREALWHDPTIRIATLPPEYNCRFIFGAFVSGPVKVLHGRGDHEAVERSINDSEGMRLWAP